MYNMLKQELSGLDFECQEFVCQACSAYLQGLDEDIRLEYQQTRGRLRTITPDIKRLRKACSIVGDQLGGLIDQIREAHRPRFSTVSFSEFVSNDGRLEYFRSKKIPDPAEPLVELRQSLINLDGYLDKEVRYIRRRIPRTRAAWKQRPILWWQKGGLEYVLLRLFTKRAKLKVVRAHQLIVSILNKLASPKRVFYKYKEQGYAPSIRRRLATMSPSYKRQCDKVLEKVFELPAKN